MVERYGVPSTNAGSMLTRDSDSSVLTRLAHVEARLQALEAQPTAATVSPGLPLALRSADGNLDYALVPDFHTAAGHKIVQYWSRLRVKLTIPNLHPFTYLKEADQADKTLILGAHQRDSDLDLPSALSFIDRFFERTDNLPIALVELVVTSSHFIKANIVESLYGVAYRRQGQASAINDAAADAVAQQHADQDRDDLQHVGDDGNGEGLRDADGFREDDAIRVEELDAVDLLREHGSACEQQLAPLDRVGGPEMSMSIPRPRSALSQRPTAALPCRQRGRRPSRPG